MAGEEQVAVGLAAGFLDEERPGAARLVAMWVAPQARGTGAGRVLIDAVVAWAAAEGASTLMLDVLPDNAAARALYERAGFTPVATDGPLDTTCGADALTLARALPTAGSSPRS
jgi:GNAT superfamily N-acetyltransferase